MIKNNLRKLREARGLSRHQLEELSNVSQWTICSIERENNGLTVETAWMLCKAFGIEWDELLGTVADGGC